ncbi:MAG: Gfo/Idh/MocA family oxidoreductase [Abditibacteriota bacterium]|nr:Gfo/Idh/MocA family oxidoreductase [Abditibacteriota bacterium]
MDKNYSVLMVGCGAISFVWFTAFAKRTDCHIAGVVDINRGMAEERAAQYGLKCPVFDDFDTALAEVKPDIVVDLTFPFCHHDITVKSLKAGAHVFGEKPMCLDRAEAQDMVKTAEETGLVYNVHQNRRSMKGTRALRKAITEGRLGKIWMTCCEIYVNSDLSSIRNTLPYPMLQDQAVHSFDSCRFILGADAETVYAHSYNPPGSKYNGDGSGACIFEMSDGSTLVFNAVMDTDYLNTPWHSQFRVIGEKGAAVWDGKEDTLPLAQLRQPDGSIKEEYLQPGDDWNGMLFHECGVEEMMSDLKAGRVYHGCGKDNYKSIAMTFSAIDSIKAGGKVKVW